MDHNILSDTNRRMVECVLKFQKNMNNVHIGRVSSALLEGISIEYYGSRIPLRELSNITVESANTLKITVFDKSIIRIVEKEIFHSKLEFTPIVNDNIIRLVIPPMTEERRKKICKFLQLDVEHTRIKIRNIRRDSKDTLKKFIKEKVISLDIARNFQNEIQILTDKYINEINNFFLKKKSEIMNF